jgi:hypothetical protein
MTKHPANDWKFVDDIEEEFVNWFTGNYGEFSFRYEWFFGDCEVEDEKIRKDLMYKWVHSAYVSGYNSGMKPHGGTE